MPPIKSIVTATSKTQFVNIPRISSSASYRAWLNKLLDVPHNRKVMMRSDKETVDQLFQTQAAQHFALDNNKWKQAMNDMASKISKQTFDRKQAALQNAVKASDAEPAEVPSNLSVPIIKSKPKARADDIWTSLSYAQFIERVERENPNAMLTKQIVDAAFRLAVSRSSAGPTHLPGREQAVIRCLGKESTKYWKDK